ncbi:MAG: PAS domain S-box protein [Fimbriimonas sp.]
MRAGSVDVREESPAMGLVRAAEEFQRLAIVVQKTRNPVVLANPEGTIVWVNAAFCEATGYSAEEAIGRRPDDLLNGPDTDRETLATLEAAFLERRSITVEIQNYRKSGEPYWVSLSLDPVGTDEHPEGYIALQTDITERKQLALRLEESERRARTMLTSLTEVVFERDEEACWTYLNPAWEELTGYSIAESLGRPAYEFVHPADVAKKRATLEALRRGGQARVRERARYVRKDGEIRWVDVLSTVRETPDGRKVSYGTLKDVTETVQTLRDLKSERDFSEAVLQTAGSLVVVVDAKGRVIRFNRACELASGYTFEQIAGREIGILFPPEEVEKVRAEFEALKAGHFPRTFENHWCHRDGSRRRILWSNTALTDEAGGVLHVVGIGQDVTHQRATEQALRESQERYELCVSGQNDGIWDYTPADGRAFYSPRWYTMLGYEPGELANEIGLFRTLLHPEDLPRVDQAMKDYVDRRRRTYELEVRVRQKDGTYRWILTRGAGRFGPDGRLIRMAGSHSDIHARKEAEAALLESQERLVEAQHLARLGSWRIDYETQRVHWSPEMFEIHGVDPQSPPAIDGLKDLFHPEDYSRFVSEAAQEFREGNPYTTTFRIVRPSGEIRYLHLVGRPVSDASGRRIGVVGSAQDITEATLAEQALQRTQDLLLQSQRVAKLGSWEVDVASGRLAYTPQTLELLGRDATLTDPTIETFVHLADANDRHRLIRRYRVAVARGQEVDFDLRIRREDGSRLVLRVLATPVLGSDGSVVRVVGSVQDVTEQREAARQLATQKAFLRSVIDTNPNLIFVKDVNGRFVLANEAVAEVYGTTADAILGKRDADFSPNPEEVDQFETMDRAVLTTEEEQIAYEEAITDSTGQTRWLQTLKRPIVSPETGETQVLGICTDITERVRIQHQLEAAREAALESSRLKSEFLANMSHEIRTPMNGVLGMADLLLDTHLEPEQVELARTIRDCGTNLLSILNDILDFSKVEAGKMSLELAKVDVAEVVEEVASLFAPRAHEKGLRISLKVDWSRPWFMRSDAVRLRQILTNLVGNALKFTEHGGVDLRVGPSSEGGMRIEVRDTGVGIATERQAAVFDSFVQADGSTTRRFGGTGLGLTIAKQLAELLNGQIGLESALGVGSTFWLEFPARALLVAAPRKTLEGARVEIHLSDPESASYVRGTLDRLGVTIQPVRGEVVIADRKPEGSGEVPWVCVLNRGDLRPDSADAVVYAPPTTRALEDAIRRVLGKSSLNPEVAVASEGTAWEVLLVEDNPVNRTVATRLLEGMGLRVRVATNGLEAVDFCSREAFPLVMMDLQMPEMDGLEATALIRELDVRLERHTPILAMTAHAMAGDRERCIAAGMDDYVSKPIRKEELREKLAKWLPEEPVETNQIDLTYLTEIAGDDMEFQREVLAAYAEGLPPMLDELRDAAARGDRDVAYRVAHTLKGSSRSVGANVFADHCERAEDAAKSGDIAAAAAELARRAEAVLRECQEFSLAA